MRTDFMVKVATRDRSIDVLRRMVQMKKEAQISSTQGIQGYGPSAQQDEEQANIDDIIAALSGWGGNQSQQNAPAPVKKDKKTNPQVYTSGWSPATRGAVSGVASTAGGIGGWYGGGWAGEKGLGWLGRKAGEGIGNLWGKWVNRDYLNPDRFFNSAAGTRGLNTGNATTPYFVDRNMYNANPTLKGALKAIGKSNVGQIQHNMSTRIGDAMATAGKWGGRALGAGAGAFGGAYAANKVLDWVDPYKGEGRAG